MLRQIPIPIKILLCFCCFPIFPIIWMGAASVEMNSALDVAVANSCEQTVGQAIEAWTRIVVSVNNHPDTWRKLRESWYKINGSNKVPTEMKRQLLAILKRKGLRLSNEKIIDNYKGSDISC